MGNRAHATITSNYGPPIYVYTHWLGEAGLIEALTAAVENPVAQARVGDAEYFTRIVLHKFLLAVADPDQDTGFGIGTSEPDGRLCLTINANTGKIERV
jgi:hypothetical protein